MARVVIDLPETFPFKTFILVRITDLNYGGHVGNDSVLSFLHEARVRYLHSLDYTEFDFGGAGLIMSDAAVAFKREMFYGQVLLVSIAPANPGRAGFDLIYKVESETPEKTELYATAKTGMVCFDYEAKKIVAVPPEAHTRLFAVEK